MGFRNIFVIFYVQKKYTSIIFPLIYLFAQMVCILQVAQNFFFFHCNVKIHSLCKIPKDTTDLELVNWMDQFKTAAVLMTYINAFKGCIGCVQWAQLTELWIKLKIILTQGD